MKQSRYMNILILALIVCTVIVSRKSKKKSFNLKENRSVSLLAMITHTWNPKKFTFKNAFRSIKKNCRRSLNKNNLYRKLINVSTKALKKAVKSSKASTGNSFISRYQSISLKLRRNFLRSVLRSFNCKVLPRSLRTTVRRLLKVRIRHSRRHRRNKKHSKRHATRHRRRVRRHKRHSRRYSRRHRRNNRRHKRHSRRYTRRHRRHNRRNRRSKKQRRHSKRQSRIKFRNNRKLNKRLTKAVISLGKIFKKNKGNFKKLLKKLAVKIVRILRNHKKVIKQPINSQTTVKPVFAQIKPIIPIMRTIVKKQPINQTNVQSQPINPQHPNWDNDNHYTLVD